MRAPDLWRRLRRDTSGASAVEFALIAPLMLVFYFGLTELCQAMLAERRVDHVAAAVGDLITQTDELSVTDINDVFQIGKTILAPFPNGTLKMRTTSVTANAQGTPLVDWSRGYNGMSARAVNSAVTLKTTLAPNASKVFTEVEYKYDSPFGFFVPDGITFKHNSELLPRKSPKVVCTAPCT